MTYNALIRFNLKNENKRDLDYKIIVSEITGRNIVSTRFADKVSSIAF